MIAHPSTADRSILDGDDNDEIDDIGQIDQIIESFEERLHRLRVQRSEFARGSTTDDNNGDGELDENSRMKEEINLQEQRLRRLRIRRNTKIPISRLPAELMAYIFTYCTPKYHFGILARGKWYFFTHVCHSWRSIALNYAPLWTLVNDHSSIKLARTMLERSKTATLDIMLWSSCFLKRRKPWEWQWQEWWELSRAIQGELPRIGHLKADIDSRDRRHIQELVYGLVQPAPSLRSIELTNFDDKKTRLPDQFLGGTAPLLTRIYLHSVEIPWKSPLLQNLTYLKLSNRGTNIPTGKQMFDALRSIPRLEVLDLAGIFPREVTETNLIPLPKLRRLSLCALSKDLDACTGFIKHLLFPRTTILCIKYFARENADAFKPILSYLSQLFAESRIEPSVVKVPRTIRSLSLGIDNNDLIMLHHTTIAFTAWNIGSISSKINDIVGPSLRLPPPILRLQLHRESRSHSRRRILDDLKAVLGSFQTNGIETFHIHAWKEKPDSEHITSTSEISECLAPILWSSSLKTLRAYGLDCFYLLPTLLDTRSGSDSRSSAESSIVAFPALLNVYVDYWPLQASVLGSLLAPLVGALESRMKYGRKLRKLTIKKYDDGLTEEQVASLKDVVDELDCKVEKLLPLGWGR